MDFSLNEEQEAVRDLARQILSDVSTPERLRQLEVAGEWVDTLAKDARSNRVRVVPAGSAGGSGHGQAVNENSRANGDIRVWSRPRTGPPRRAGRIGCATERAGLKPGTTEEKAPT